MRIVAIIQARMGSTRLPGKVLMPLGGIPVLQHVVERALASRAFDEVVVATTTAPTDDPIVSACRDYGVRSVRGDEDDVLQRYSDAAAASEADAVMRITSDCPLIDPDVLSAMVSNFRLAHEGASRPDLITNARVRTFPRGLDAELFTRAALETMVSEARNPEEREHVTLYLYRHPDRFRIVDHVGERIIQDCA